MQTVVKQLELEFWQELIAADNQPEATNLQQLLQDLERVIKEVEEDQRLLLAGEAIAKIVEIYVKKANLILDSLEVRDTSVGQRYALLFRQALPA